VDESGKPMSTRKIPLYKIYWDQDDVDSVSNVIEQGMSWAIGSNVDGFEQKVAEYVGRKFAVAFNSGTSALHAILLAYEVGLDHEVIVPSFTFIATANSALFVGARPVFADIEERTFGLDPEDVEKKITKRTKVIMPIHYGGGPCLIEGLRKVAEDHKLLLIEDAAESLGASINGRRVGSFGDAAVLSFCGNKVITTGEGGVVATDERNVYEKLKLIRSHGRLETEDYFASSQVGEYIALGYNWRMSNIIAALGISQMKKLDRVVALRRKNAEYLTRKLSNLKAITPPNPPNGHHHVYQMYVIRVKGGVQIRDALQNHLSTKGITTKVYFSPAHLSHFYRTKFGFKGGELPVTEKLSEQVLTLPIYATMTMDEMDYIVSSTQEFVENPRK
jgi:perosamine synthetase